uniref:Ripply transcriptional repressor 2 n=1 Tax=Accipiter nisus TaxID=211598 RepID=A0A8B9MRP3_9AVES
MHPSRGRAGRVKLWGRGCVAAEGVGWRGARQGESGPGWAAVMLNLLSAPRSLPLWRPWLPGAEEGTEQRRQQMDTVSSTLPAAAVGRQGPSPRLCPRRLLWPKSKSFDYLYGVGEKLLENFPVQATLCLYEDSGSEEEEEEEEEEDGHR